jgi:hypothetical protein
MLSAPLSYKKINGLGVWPDLILYIYIYSFDLSYLKAFFIFFSLSLSF